MSSQAKLLYADIRTPNMLPDRSADVFFSDDEPSMTNQQFVRECDINFIVKQNAETGFISHVNHLTPQWGDFGNSTDYQSALNYLQEANDSFMALPAEVRARFQNDPAQLLDFVTNIDNMDEAVKLGLASYNANYKPADEKTTSSSSKDSKTSETPA